MLTDGKEVVMEPFERVVDAHGEAVWRVCRSLLPAADADDAWSETFLAALQAYPKLTPDSNVRGWLVTIAYRKAIDEIRGVARRPTVSDSLPETLSSISSSSGPAWVDYDDLRIALRALTDRQQRAVVYRYICDFTYDDIAALLSCTTAAARRVVADAMANLRRDFTKATTNFTEATPR